MDLSRDLPLIVLLAVSFLLAVGLAAAEISLVRVSRVRVETLAEDDARARRLVGLLDDLPLVLNAILLTVLLVQIGAATVTGILAERWFGNLAVAVATAVLTVVLFVYTEAIPKTYAYHHPTRVAMLVTVPVSALAWTLRPIVRALVWFADLHAPGEGVATTPTVTERELRRLAREAAEEGAITGEDLGLLEGAFVLGDRAAEEVMVPRVDVVAVPAEATVREALDAALVSGHRRLVVYREDLDDVLGVVRLRDLVRAAHEDERSRVAALARAPLFVTEWTATIDLLRRMQDQSSHFAVVVDEHGGTAGIVTIEDIAEELLGSVADEGAAPAPEIRSLEGDRWVVDGSVLAADLEATLETDLPEGEWTTVGGLVLGTLGRIPDEGDEIDVGEWTFRVDTMAGRRIRLLVVTRSDSSSQRNSDRNEREPRPPGDET